MTRPLKLVASLLVVGVAVLLGFGAGLLTAQSAPGVVRAATATPSSRPTSGLESEFGTFWEVWRIVEGEFYNPAALDYKKLTYGAIGGMLAALGDPHTSFASPTIARMVEDDLKGSFDGIGAQLEMRDNQLTIVAPIEDTPAERAGIRAGDRILRIDDEDTLNLSLMDAVSRIRGPRGSTVTLTVGRDGAAEPLNIEIVRDEIKSVNVRTRMLDGGIGYLKLNSFAETSGDEVRAGLEKLRAEQPRAIVLDLRNNPGGLLTSSVDVTSQFLADGVVLYQSRRDAEPIEYRAKSGGVATSLPMVVLINRGSASASEIVAGALQDQGRARLVGENSFGKDSVQNVHSLKDKSSVRVTFSRWYTPNRQDIHEKGLRPDVTVLMTEDDVKAQRDPQLDRAVEILKAELAK